MCPQGKIFFHLGIKTVAVRCPPLSHVAVVTFSLLPFSVGWHTLSSHTITPTPTHTHPSTPKILLRFTLTPTHLHPHTPTHTHTHSKRILANANTHMSNYQLLFLPAFIRKHMSLFFLLFQSYFSKFLFSSSFFLSLALAYTCTRSRTRSRTHTHPYPHAHAHARTFFQMLSHFIHLVSPLPVTQTPLSLSLSLAFSHSPILTHSHFNALSFLVGDLTDFSDTRSLSLVISISVQKVEWEHSGQKKSKSSKTLKTGKT